MALNTSNFKKKIGIKSISNAIIAYEGYPTAFFEAILNQVASSGMQENYANHNVDLVLWIYDKDNWRDALLRNWRVEHLITSEAEGKRVMRDTCKGSLKAINGNDDNCPILLEKMRFNLFPN